MCGIIGIIGKAAVAPLLLDGLKRLEYRGYDSAGIATLVNGHIDAPPRRGQARQSRGAAGARAAAGTIGIGHTRWATHGRPNETNAHPHATDRVAVVHNGIIENFDELRHELSALGHNFETETDTEVVAHLLTRYLQEQKTPEQAMAAGHGAAARRLRARGHLRRAPRPHDRRPARQPARRRLWRRRDVSRLRRALALAPLTQPHLLSGGGRLGRASSPTAPRIFNNGKRGRARGHADGALRAP